MIEKRFHPELFWNYCSLVVLAISGILLNLIIAGFFDSSTLGVFNQIVAIYIVFAQLAVWGVQFSVLKHVAKCKSNPSTSKTIILSALVMVAITSFFFSALLYLSRDLIGNILGSNNVAVSLPYIALATIFFAFNKILLSALNGLGLMNAFAFINGSRYLLIVLIVFFLSLAEVQPKYLPVAFLVSELVLLPLQIFFIQRELSDARALPRIDWTILHMLFGTRALLSGIFAELNTRVDILMLGIFMSDRDVGLYSFSAMLAEGFYQLFVVLRNNINPHLVRMVASGSYWHLRQLFVRLVKVVYPVSLIIALTTLGLFLPAISLFPQLSEFEGSYTTLAILIVGYWAISGFIPFEQILNQAGFPWQQSVIGTVSFVANIVLNSTLIPVFGLVGAACATVCAYIIAFLLIGVTFARRCKVIFDQK